MTDRQSLAIVPRRLVPLVMLVVVALHPWGHTAVRPGAVGPGPTAEPGAVAAARGEEPAAERAGAGAPAVGLVPATEAAPGQPAWRPPARVPLRLEPDPAVPTQPPPTATPVPVATAGPAGTTPRPAVAGVALPTHRVAIRVAVPALGIDLPVTRQATAYPACNVAMYLRELKQPGQGGVTYLYSHARVGNFLPLLEESRINDGQRMLGMTVRVWTGDNYLFTYRIIEVRRHVTDFAPAFAWQGESVWLQTSEGPRGTVPKLQVIAEHVRTEPTDYALAHPVPRPVSCS